MEFRVNRGVIVLGLLAGCGGTSFAQSNSERTQVVSIDRHQILDKKSPSRLNMVTIYPGQFQMGSPIHEARRERTEGPVQTVSIDYTFEVGKYEVTFADWDKCVASGGCNGYRPSDVGWGRGKRPVVNISWNDAQSYIKWLNKKTGLKYRLLSEAEWEYIARAGTSSPFSTGHMITTQQANFNGQKSYQGSPLGPYRRQTVEVGSYSANPYGLHDLHGNAWEWTQDCWNDTHVGNAKNGKPRTSGDCNYRVMKGGSWVNRPDDIRVAQRQRYTTDYRYDDYGFRIARTLSKKAYLASNE
ncbi:MAG: formylglycine-generating enzyme family protein [Hyphomonadaceae bacterium]|nr:formylglycine-generating enzyme family protein [Hyphomonadaceae bacterium]